MNNYWYAAFGYKVIEQNIHLPRHDNMQWLQGNWTIANMQLFDWNKVSISQNMITMATR